MTFPDMYPESLIITDAYGETAAFSDEDAFRRFIDECYGPYEPPEEFGRSWDELSAEEQDSLEDDRAEYYKPEDALECYFTEKFDKDGWPLYEGFQFCRENGSMERRVPVYVVYVQNGEAWFGADYLGTHDEVFGLDE